MQTALKVQAKPYEFVFVPEQTALVIIDMQRDFVQPGGFGQLLGNDVTKLQKAIDPTRCVLNAFRQRHRKVLHTREGHRPDLSDCPPSKKARGRLKVGIGDKGPMGRVLVRGEQGHGIVPARSAARRTGDRQARQGGVLCDRPGFDLEELGSTPGRTHPRLPDYSRRLDLDKWTTLRFSG